jgi:hypothetical protein
MTTVRSTTRVSVLLLALGFGASGCTIQTAPPPPVAGPAPAVLVVHDIHADTVRARVIRAHDVHADSLRAGAVYEVKGEKHGKKGQHLRASVVEADEIDAHNIHARVVEVGTLYVHKVHTRR